ncbi:GAD-like domain-containing protein [Arachnia propionica]|uniref:GAD-like domain-containing protein n=1 Tax=Arachnia propionica TaxID=1750 RepID=UPI00398FC132
MVELRCDPGWVEERLAESFEYRGGPLGVGEAASPEVLEYFEGIFPASTLQVWRTIGFDGLNWITNPLEWAPAVESWLEGVELPFPPQRWWCITRTPMGSMQLWGEVSGPALAIKSVLGAFSPNGSVQRDMADPVIRERMGCNRLLSLSEDVVTDDVTGRSLVDVGFERFGSLGVDEVFALVPAYCLSGRMEASMLAVEPAVAHVAFLGQSTQPTMRPDMLATFGSEIADLLAAQGVVDPATGKPITFNQ